jgi:hypothetical protein
MTAGYRPLSGRRDAGATNDFCSLLTYAAYRRRTIIFASSGRFGLDRASAGNCSLFPIRSVQMVRLCFYSLVYLFRGDKSLHEMLPGEAGCLF